MRREREKIYIYGKHALTEALLNAPRVIRKIFLSSEAANDRELRFLINKEKIPFELMKGKDADRKVGEDTAHQGVIASADPSLLMHDFSSFIRELEPTEDTMFVILDELTDPHNVGAIIRSAAAFGAAGVIMPARRQASVTGAVVKTSAGMVFRVPLIETGNVNYALDALKEKGFRAYALAMAGARDASREKFDAPSVFIIGNEGSGIRQKTLERADVALRIPMHPRTESLNAAVSASIVLHEWCSQHPQALK